MPKMPIQIINMIWEKTCLNKLTTRNVLSNVPKY